MLFLEFLILIQSCFILLKIFISYLITFDTRWLTSNKKLQGHKKITVHWQDKNSTCSKCSWICQKQYMPSEVKHFTFFPECSEWQDPPCLFGRPFQSTGHHTEKAWAVAQQGDMLECGEDIEDRALGILSRRKWNALKCIVLAIC